MIIRGETYGHSAGLAGVALFPELRALVVRVHTRCAPRGARRRYTFITQEERLCRYGKKEAGVNSEVTVLGFSEGRRGCHGQPRYGV